MVCFHLLRPYKAPEKHPPCCSMCERVCGFVCLRERVRQCFCFPACTDMVLLLKEPELWTRQYTQTPVQKTNEGSKHGRMQAQSPWLVKKKTPLFQRRKQALNSLFSITISWMSSDWKHVPCINSMKIGLAYFPSVIYWSDEWLGLKIKCSKYKVAIHASNSRRPESKAHVKEQIPDKINEA